MKRTDDKIEKEIKALEALVPVGSRQHATQQKIDIMIEELRHGVDQTADEWNELPESERAAAEDARHWKEGDTEDRPSEGWGPLVK